MAKFPWPPSADDLQLIAPELHTLRTGTVVVRIYRRGGRHPMTWRAFRFEGPLPSARFDHHVDGEHRGVLYGARDLVTCVAEGFQSSRVVDRTSGDPFLVAFSFVRAVRLLDLTGDWPTRAGARQAIASGVPPRAQAWARAVCEAYPRIDGVWYPSSMHGGHPALALYERAGSSLSTAAELDIPLSHPGLLPDLTRAASSLGYLLV